MKQRIGSASILFIIFGSVAAMAQTDPTVEEILKNIKAKFDQVKDYTADLTAEIHFENMRIPKMEAKMYFKQPDRVHFEPKGGSFAMFPKDAVGFNPTEFMTANYDAVVQGREMIGNVNCYKLKLLSKTDTVRIQRMMLYVDPQFWVVKKIATSPQRGGDVDVHFDHQLIDSKYLLPVKITVSMDAPSPGRKQQLNSGIAGEAKKGSVVITYQNYAVNRGISDAVFDKKKKDDK